MKKNIKSFSGYEALQREVERRARSMLDQRGIKDMCLNACTDRAIRELSKHCTRDADNNLLIDDDHVAAQARQVVSDSIYHSPRGF